MESGLPPGGWAGHGSAMSLDLKVIGAGLGRTGTTSLREALSVLLDGPCFHMLEFQLHPELMRVWRAFVEATPMRSAPKPIAAVPASHWERLMPGYVACVDEPACFYWKQLAQAFPEALVILSLRDPDSWWDSVLHVEKLFLEEARHPDRLSDERRAFHEFTEGIYPEMKDGLCEATEKALFEEHNRQVLEFAERDPSFKKRLLIWHVEEGWAPICSALGVTVPEIPFPHRNKRAEYHGY